jgi:hypothetical protein
MLHEKIILSTTALVVTVLGSFSFRHTNTSNHKLYTTTNIKRCNIGFCLTVRCFTVTGTPQHPCKLGSTKYYTDVSSPSNPYGGCTHRWTGNTTVTL